MGGEVHAGIALAALAFGFSRWVDRPLGCALATGGAFGFGLALGSAHWVPAAVVSLGATPLQAAVTSLILGVWLGSLPYSVIAAGVWLAGSAPRWLQATLVGGIVYLLETGLDGFALDLPWTRLGHAFVWDLDLAGVLSMGGVPAVSAIAATPSAAFGFWWSNRRSKRASPARTWVLPVLLLLTLAMVAETEAGSTAPATEGPGSLRVLGIQPRLPRSGRWDPELQPLHLDRLSRFSLRAIAEVGEPPDVVLWPENVVTLPIDDARIEDALRRSIAKLGVPLLAGLQARAADRRDGGSARSSGVYLFRRDAVVVDRVEKERPVPGFESRPEHWLAVDLMKMLLGGALAAEPVVPGPESRASQGQLVRLLCFEALFPPVAARRRSDDSAGIVVLADDSWIERPSARRQLAMLATLRSAELGLPLMRIAHGGISLRTDARGRVVEALALNEWGAIEARWPTRRTEARRADAAAADSALRRFRSFVKGSQIKGGRRT